MNQPNHPFPIFYHSHKCHQALQLLQPLLEHNHEEIFRGTQGDILRDAVVKFKTRRNELGSQETEKPWLDVQLGESPGREVLLYHLKGLHQTLERSIDIAMDKNQVDSSHRAGGVLVGCLHVIADQISRLCLVVDEILEVLDLEGKLPSQPRRRAKTTTSGGFE
ncbi:hypothetical protein BDW72DRAFT_197324 [Aspergillus terricola var. indicus]